MECADGMESENEKELYSGGLEKPEPPLFFCSFSDFCFELVSCVVICEILHRHVNFIVKTGIFGIIEVWIICIMIQVFRQSDGKTYLTACLVTGHNYCL